MDYIFLMDISDVCREAARASLTRHLGVCNIDNALKACVERSGGRLLARKRMPRYCSPTEVSISYHKRSLYQWRDYNTNCKAGYAIINTLIAINTLT